MSRENKILNDVGQLITNAMGVAQGAKNEMETAVQNRINRYLSERNFVTRDEFEAVSIMAQKAREENEALKARIEALEVKKRPTKAKK